MVVSWVFGSEINELVVIVCLVFEFLKLFEDGEILIVLVFIICERDVNSF